MFDNLKRDHGDKPDRDILLLILAEQLLTNQKLDKMSNDAQDLQALVQTLKDQNASIKTSLDAVKDGVGKIVAGIPAGGLSADEVTALKASLNDAITSGAANVQEAQEDAAAVAAAQPAAPVTPAP